MIGRFALAWPFALCSVSSYHRGGLTLLDFLDAERSYRAEELGYRQTLASYLLALEQLREAVGVRNLP